MGERPDIYGLLKGIEGVRAVREAGDHDAEVMGITFPDLLDPETLLIQISGSARAVGDTSSLERTLGGAGIEYRIHEADMTYSFAEAILYLPEHNVLIYTGLGD